MTTTAKPADLRQLLSRFDADCIRCFQGATSLCASRSHYEIAAEHLLLRLLDDTGGDVTRVFETFKVDRSQIRRALQHILEDMHSGHKGKPALSPKLVELFSSAAVMADEFRLEQIRPGLLILAFALNPGHTRVGEFTPELDRIDVDQLRDNFHEIVLGAAGEAPSGSEGMTGPDGGPVEGGALDQYTIDLTAKAAAGQIDPVFARDHEIRQMIDIFARRRKNNPILVGEPGTGKTAIVEGLALRIIKGDVPPTLHGVKLVCLDLGLLQAGAGVKGEFENRLKNVIREIKESSVPIITFIDEAHTLIGAGGAAGGGGDAANLLKPALARGELRTVAATTWAEYKKYFEKDAALERRFQLVRCDEPSVPDTIVMLRGLKDRYEEHHKVLMLDEAVSAAANLSKRYISGRFLPDKAVDLLDTAAARVALSICTPPASLEDIDRELTSLATGVAAVKRDEASGLSPDAGVLEEMEERSAALLVEREALEKQWHTERDAVNNILELRRQMTGFRTGEAPEETTGEGNGKADKAGKAGKTGTDGAVAKKDNKKAPAKTETEEPKAPPVDEAKLAKQISDAMAELKKIQGEEPLVHPQVDGAAIATVVSDWTGIPIGSMVKDEIEATLNMEARLGKRVVGQDHALKIIAQKLRTTKAGIGNPTQPMGVFLCVGPSGVGKTELALAVADLLFGGEQFLTAINMSEFMESHTVSQLKGSPPGYIGYGEGGVLTEAVRQHPYSVVLLDEIEKAHPDVMNLFYQVFDKGQLADGEGRVVNFKNTVIIMTSNLGTDAIQNMCESGEDFDLDDLMEAIYPHLRERLKPALVARMTVIPFYTLGNEVLQLIAKIKLGKLGKLVTSSHKMEFVVDEAVYAEIAGRCNQVDLGARQIDHEIDRSVTPVLSVKLLEQMADDTMPTKVVMSVSEDKEFMYTFSSEG